ncbi:unnamed protein product [Vicia faba]|uniref:Uncharacterized protein n=1 Tax=Vicia faba TaxID=3906 RepID=A0AAV1B0W0_VICFA|nr:unnamed protein product [Vicia faba]
MKQSHRWQRSLLLSLLSLSVVAPVIFVSHRLRVVTRDGRREFLDDLSSVKYRTDPFKLNAIEQEELEELQEPKQVVYKENDFGSKNSGDSDKNNDSEDLEELEEPKQVVHKENDFGSKNSYDSEKNNDYEDSEELEEPKQVVYKENDFGSKNSDDSKKNNESEDSRIEGSRNNYSEKKEFDHDDETQDREDQQKELSSTDGDQEDLEELEEASKLVIKKMFLVPRLETLWKKILIPRSLELRGPKIIFGKERIQP